MELIACPSGALKCVIGAECKHPGHGRLRYSRDGHCVECVAEKARRYEATPEQKQRKAERMRRYQAIPEVKQRRNEAKRRYKATPEGKEARRRYLATPEGKQHAAEATRRYRASPEGKQHLAEYRTRYAATEKGLASVLRHTYGLSLDGYRQLAEQQQHKCAGCGLEAWAEPHGTRGLHVDHDHQKTGAASVRALLCSRCNHSLGLTGDNPEILRRLADLVEGKPLVPLTHSLRV